MLSLRASSKPERSSTETTNCTRKREEQRRGGEGEAGQQKDEEEEHLLGQLKTHDDRRTKLETCFALRRRCVDSRVAFAAIGKHGQPGGR